MKTNDFNLSGRPVFRRGISGLLFKYPAEIERIFISDDRTDLLNRIIRASKQLFGPGDTQEGDILHWRHSHVVSEAADKPADAHMTGGSVFLNGNGSSEGFIEILNCPENFFLIGTKAKGTFLLASVDFCKKQTKIMGRKFFEAGATKLQFSDNLSEQFPVFRENSHMELMFF